MSNWSIVVPAETEIQNYVTNPSFERGTDGWTTGGNNEIARVSHFQFRGVGALRAFYVDDLTLARQSADELSLPANVANYYMTARVRLSADWDGGAVSLGVGGMTGATVANVASANATSAGRWVLVEAILTTASDTTGYLTLTAASAPTPGRQLWLDCVMVSFTSARVTYFDGDGVDAAWDGERHRSVSRRRARSTAGGYVRNLYTDLGLLVEQSQGQGAPSFDNWREPYALLPGSKLQGIRLLERVLQLTITTARASLGGLLGGRQGLIDALSPLQTPGSPERLWRFDVDGETAEIPVIYEGGLEYVAQRGGAERAPLRLLAADPFWYELKEGGAELGYEREAKSGTPFGLALTITTGKSFEGIIARKAGVFDDLDAGISPYDIRAIAKGPDGCLYVGGSFTTIGGVSANRIAKFDPVDRSWAALSSGADSQVKDLKFHPNGDLYAAGDFTTIGGVSTRSIAVWDGSSWAAVGGGTTGPGGGISLAIAPNGDVYLCGLFSTIGGSSISGIARWDGSTWSALGSGLGGGSPYAYTVAINAAGLVYAGGFFTTADGITVNRIAKYDPDTDAWAALGSGMDATVEALDFSPAGRLVAGGSFSTAGGNTAQNVASWDGSTWSALGDGPPAGGGGVGSLVYDPDGVLYTLSYSTAGQIGIWNGSTWVTPDFSWDASGWSAGRLWFDDSALEPVLYVCGAEFTDLKHSALNLLTNEGTADAWPIFEFERSGAAPYTLYWIRNETTGKTLFFDYPLADGERVIIDTRPGRRSVSSNMWINSAVRLKANSDLSEFYLVPGVNHLSVYAPKGNSYPGSLTANATWRIRHLSVDALGAL